MKMQFRSHKVVLLALSTIVIMVGIYTAINYLYPATDDSSNALTYSSNTDVSFTFKPTLSIGLSSDSLTIDNLVPGTTNDSNTVSVTVSSNTPYGYVLSAGVGSNDTTSPYYNTSSLTHENTTISNVFSSVDTNASLDSLDTNNTWGYSTSTNGGASWSTYSGLSHTATKPLLDISDPATPSTIDFKIAARSATTQASGTYNNVITFYAVGKPTPVYMQEPEIIESRLKNVGDEMQAIDQRDGKEYWVAKLADGNIWMTQNLDLYIEKNRVYTSRDTDLAYSSKGSTWVPKTSTHATHDTTWSYSTTSLESYDPGELYWNGNYDTTYINGTFNNMTVTDPTATPGGHHYHIGNYYNWTAAVAMNSSSYTDNNTDVNQSICPAGWRLPQYTRGKTFASLVEKQGLTVGVDGNIQESPTYFIYGGSWAGNYSQLIGSVSWYWSSMFLNKDSVHYLWYNINGDLNSRSYGGRSTGISIRCVVR